MTPTGLVKRAVLGEPATAGRTAWVTRIGLVVVLTAAAVLSFAALRDLGIAVRIHRELAWLLPIAVDAGAAVSCGAWLSPRSPADAARFARALTWALLVLTVSANAAGLGMAAAGITPPWWAAVLVGAIPPAVVGGVVHLAVLLGRVPAALPVGLPAGDETGAAGDDAPAELLDEHGVSRLWETASPVESPARPLLLPVGDGAGEAGDQASDDRAAQLIAEGAGRRRLARELDITEHAARELLETYRNGGAA